MYLSNHELLLYYWSIVKIIFFSVIVIVNSQVIEVIMTGLPMKLLVPVLGLTIDLLLHPCLTI